MISKNLRFFGGVLDVDKLTPGLLAFVVFVLNLQGVLLRIPQEVVEGTASRHVVGDFYRLSAERTANGPRLYSLCYHLIVCFNFFKDVCWPVFLELKYEPWNSCIRLHLCEGHQGSQGGRLSLQRGSQGDCTAPYMPVCNRRREAYLSISAWPR